MVRAWYSLVAGLILFCSLASAADSYSCLNPCSLSLQYCDFVPFPVYPIGLNVTENEALAGDAFTDPLLGLAPPNCRTAIKLFTCSQLYPSCVANSSSSTGITEVKPCVSMCQSVHDICTDVLLELLPEKYKSRLNCSAVKEDGTPMYESSSSCVSITNLTNPCNNNTNPTPGIPYNHNNTNPDGGCQAYNATANPITGKLCAPFISKMIFVSDPSSALAQPGLDTIAATQIRTIESVFPMLPIHCYKMLTSLVCQSAYPTCQQVNSTYEIPEPHCNSYCHDALAACAEVFAVIHSNETNINCSQISPLDKKPLWPEQDVCNTATFPKEPSVQFVFPEFDQCPTVLGRKKNPDETEAHCAFPCPDHSFNNSQKDTLYYITSVLGGLAFFLNAFLSISQALVAERRRYPAIFQMWLTVAVGGFGFPFLLNGPNPETEVWCSDEGTYNSISTSARCGIQGFLFIYFGLQSMIWCMVIAGSLLFTVGMNRSKVQELHKYKIPIYLFVFLVPMIFAVAAAATDNIGYVPILPVCFIQFEKVNGFSISKGDGMTIDFPLFFIPIGVFCVSSIVCFVIVVFKVREVKTGIKNMTSENEVAKRAQNRMLYFIISLSLIILLLLEWRFEVQANLSSIEEDTLAWYVCKIKTELGMPDPGECESDHSPYGVNFGHLAFACVLATVNGIIVFLLLGLVKENYIWGILYKLALKKDWKTIKFVIVEGVPKGGLPTLTTGSESSHNKSDSLQSSGSQVSMLHNSSNSDREKNSVDRV